MGVVVAEVVVAVAVAVALVVGVGSGVIVAVVAADVVAAVVGIVLAAAQRGGVKSGSIGNMPVIADAVEAVVVVVEATVAGPLQEARVMDLWQFAGLLLLTSARAGAGETALLFVAVMKLDSLVITTASFGASCCS